MLRRDTSDTPEQSTEYARELAKKVFFSLFNKAESAAVLDLPYEQARDENAYYHIVFCHCCQRNLQAVLDEYAHVLGA